MISYCLVALLGLMIHLNLKAMVVWKQIARKNKDVVTSRRKAFSLWYWIQDNFVPFLLSLGLCIVGVLIMKEQNALTYAGALAMGVSVSAVVMNGKKLLFR